MFCWKCGKEIPDDSESCTFCGQSMAGVQVVKSKVQEKDEVQPQPAGDTSGKSVDIPGFVITGLFAICNMLFIVSVFLRFEYGYTKVGIIKYIKSYVMDVNVVKYFGELIDAYGKGHFISYIFAGYEMIVLYLPLVVFGLIILGAVVGIFINISSLITMNFSTNKLGNQLIIPTVAIFFANLVPIKGEFYKMFTMILLLMYGLFFLYSFIRGVVNSKGKRITFFLQYFLNITVAVLAMVIISYYRKFIIKLDAEYLASMFLVVGLPVLVILGLDIANLFSSVNNVKERYNLGASVFVRSLMQVALVIFSLIMIAGEDIPIFFIMTVVLNLVIVVIWIIKKILEKEIPATCAEIVNDGHEQTVKKTMATIILDTFVICATAMFLLCVWELDKDKAYRMDRKTLRHVIGVANGSLDEEDYSEDYGDDYYSDGYDDFNDFYGDDYGNDYYDYFGDDDNSFYGDDFGSYDDFYYNY